jgi:HSP20 family protein
MFDVRSLVPWARGGEPARRDLADPFYALRRDMDRLFDEFWRGVPTGALAVTPQIDLEETDTELVVKAELPGVESKDVELNLAGDLLTLKGEKKHEEETNEAGRHLVERSYGSFSRSIRLPYEVDADKAAANFENGVLTVRMPKPEGLQKAAKRIEIAAR